MFTRLHYSCEALENEATLMPTIFDESAANAATFSSTFALAPVRNHRG